MFICALYCLFDALALLVRHNGGHLAIFGGPFGGPNGLTCIFIKNIYLTVKQKLKVVNSSCTLSLHLHTLQYLQLQKAVEDFFV